MRKRRVAVAAAVVIGAGALWSPVVGHADTATTFYVNNNNTRATCSDATTDSATAPYCTIQAAVDAATVPGDVVQITGGLYAPFTVTASGTAAAPISIDAEATGLQQLYVDVRSVSSSTTPGISVSGASYVDISGPLVDQYAPFAAVSIANSSHIDVDNGHLAAYPQSPAPTVSISDSSDVTISRSEMWSQGHTSVVDVHGGAGDIVTTNSIEPSTGAIGVTFDGTTGSAITGNSILRGCSSEVMVMNGATSASIQNNDIDDLTLDGDCPTPGASTAALSVDASSSAGTTVDYNDVDATPTASPGVAPYVWGGTAYATAAALDAATGEGAHDVNTSDASALIDSANSAASGEMSTDYQGNPRVDDPLMTNTGAGPRTYDDRGALEAQDTVIGTRAANWPSSMPSGGTGTFTTTVADAWGERAVTSCAFVFQDGPAEVTTTPQDGQCTAQHTYSGVGTYYPSVTVTTSDGATSTLTSQKLVIQGTGGMVANLNVQATAARDASISNIGTDPWNIVSCHIDFGDGTSTDLTTGTCSADHHYSQLGTYPVTMSLADSGGNSQTLKSSFTALGYYYNPMTPVRVLDTRNATGVPTTVPVGPNGILKLHLAGVDGIPADAVAVALNVTATDATRNGFATAYPDGSAIPTASTLNFAAEQVVPNLAIIKLGSDGSIDLKNSSTGTVDFVADLEGYYAATGQQYIADTPTRLVDTRASKSTIPAGGTLRVDLNAAAGTSAAVLNATVTDTAAAGFLTAYPDGTVAPNASNLNFAKGQTVANEVMVKAGAGGYVDFKNTSSGSVDLVVDLNGSFQPDGGAAYIPVDPTRILDTRNGTGGTGGGGITPYASISLTVPQSSVLGNHSIAAVAGNLTVTQPGANGYISLSMPTSSLNFAKGQTIANAATVRLVNNDLMAIYNESEGTTQVIFDVYGYYT